MAQGKLFREYFGCMRFCNHRISHWTATNVFANWSAAIITLQIGLRCSHALTFDQLTELRDLLRQAIDGGQKLRLDLWHPLRSRVWHPSTKVTEIQLQLRRVWNDVLTKHSPLDSNDWYVVEISKALQCSDTHLPLTTASSRS